MSHFSPRVGHTSLKILSASVLLAIASVAAAQAPVPSPAPAGAVGAAGPASPAATGVMPSAPAPRPFSEIIKGAKEIPGFFTLYQKDEKVWIAIKPEQLDKPFFFTYNIPQSVGERESRNAVLESARGIIQLSDRHIRLAQ